MRERIEISLMLLTAMTEIVIMLGVWRHWG
jgi:hypothetical protein